MWTNTLNALARDADSAGMLPCPRKPPRRVDRETPRERILGAWGDVQNALYRATGTPSVIEAGHRLRFRGMSLRITDVILMMGFAARADREPNGCIERRCRRVRVACGARGPVHSPGSGSFLRRDVDGELPSRGAYELLACFRPLPLCGERRALHDCQQGRVAILSVLDTWHGPRCEAARARAHRGDPASRAPFENRCMNPRSAESSVPSRRTNS